MQAKALLRAEARARPRPVWQGFEARVREHVKKLAAPLEEVFEEWVERWRWAANYNVGLVLYSALEAYVTLRAAWDAMPEAERVRLDPGLCQLALLLQAGEQASWDQDQWQMAWFLTLLPAPPESLGYRKVRSRREDPMGLAPSVDPKWGNLALNYIGDVDLMLRKRAAVAAGTAMPAEVDPALGPAAAAAGAATRRLSWKEWKAKKAAEAKAAEELRKKK